MTTRVVGVLLAFWFTQAIAQVVFKWGSGSDSRWLWGFIGGNLLGLLSVWLLMLLYKAINPNIALCIALGGSFLLAQIALAIVFKSQIAPMQWVGVAATITGMLLVSMTGPRTATAHACHATTHDAMQVVQMRNDRDIHMTRNTNHDK